MQWFILFGVAYIDQNNGMICIKARRPGKIISGPGKARQGTDGTFGCEFHRLPRSSLINPCSNAETSLAADMLSQPNVDVLATERWK